MSARLDRSQRPDDAGLQRRVDAVMAGRNEPRPVRRVATGQHRAGCSALRHSDRPVARSGAYALGRNSHAVFDPRHRRRSRRGETDQRTQGLLASSRGGLRPDQRGDYEWRSGRRRGRQGRLGRRRRGRRLGRRRPPPGPPPGRRQGRRGRRGRQGRRLGRRGRRGRRQGRRRAAEAAARAARAAAGAAAGAAEAAWAAGAAAACERLFMFLLDQIEAEIGSAS